MRPLSGACRGVCGLGMLGKMLRVLSFSLSRAALLVLFFVVAAATGMAACAPAEEATAAPTATTITAPTMTTVTDSSTAVPMAAGETRSFCEEDATMTDKTMRWSQPPEMQIDPTKKYTATLETEVGNIIIELAADKVPITVNNFVFLACEGYYNGTTFHRVIADFMVQGGDPTASGSGGPGYTITDEFDASLRHDSIGVLSMANIGRPNTGGAQFFITLIPTPWLDDAHAVFGKVTEGLDVLRMIRIRDPGSDPNPGASLHSVTVTEA